MQIRTLLIGTAFACIFYLLRYAVESMPTWIAYTGIIICILVIIGAISAPAPIVDKWNDRLNRLLKRGTIRQEKIATTRARMSNVDTCKKALTIQGQEPSNRPSILAQIVSTVCGLIIFAYGLLMLNFWRIGKLTIQNYLYWFLFIGIFIIFPALILLDTYVWERKYYKLNKSAVEKHKTYTLRENLDKVFNSCLKVLKDRIALRENSRILKMERPKSMAALIGGSMITIETRQVEEGVIEIYFQSDSQWLTTKFDWGTNQKNVEIFEDLILAEVGK